MTSSASQNAAWPAIDAAQVRRVPRVPFHVLHNGQRLAAGSIARDHLGALARWPEALRIDDQGVTLTVAPPDRNAFFDRANLALREAGCIVAWRDETYPLLAIENKLLLATFERAASRFWGTLTFGAHCNGCVLDAAGRPGQVWIARRSYTKATDPGLLDNLIGGGVPFGQSPAETLLREGWEEAGLLPEQMRGLKPGHLLRIARDIPEGFQLEEISVYDLALPAGLTPCNQDGEVHSISLMSAAEALTHAATDAMTVDASLATLDFALRHSLLPEPQHAKLSQAMSALRLGLAELPPIQFL